MEPLEARVAKIEERNKAVELDKAWETSRERKTLIVSFTYVVVGIFLQTIGVESPWVSAIVPVLAFLLSTLTVQALKKRWIERQRTTSASLHPDA